MRNDQVAVSPGHGRAVRGTAHLIMVEGLFGVSQPLHRVPRSMNRSPRPQDAAGECGALPTCSSPSLRDREERVSP